ncbi:hypothetical protein L3X38_043085 [Prunus dulcis]|uniref:Uncharacterized protein n=1 Tax=Prunus dulcis TaxID=3755 RepID=A0AAD4UXG4_PRUDU|nr:hypothetical protein L3X38_043085 [Prunus dulcis]
MLEYGRVEHCKEILQCVVFGLWRLWKSRNSDVFDGCIWDPGDFVDQFHSQMQEYKVAQTSTKPVINELPRPPEQHDRSNCKWTKPAQGWKKANCDGAWLKHTQKGSVGWHGFGYGSGSYQRSFTYLCEDSVDACGSGVRLEVPHANAKR